MIQTNADEPGAIRRVDGRELTYAKAIVTRGLDLALTLASSVPVFQPDPGLRAFSLFENNLGMRFLYVPAGAFVMGSPPHEPDVKTHEQAHGVTLSTGFFFQTTPVTVDHWHAFSEETGHKSEAESNGSLIWGGHGVTFKKGYHWKEPGFRQAGDFPVTCITYGDAVQFIGWLRKTDGRLYDLPTEAQWEYACRAGSAARYFFSPDEERLEEYAWFWGNSGSRPHAVAQKSPNAWGFYDMLGNVWELCRDHCDLKHGPRGTAIVSDTYGKGELIDPLCTRGPFRICRGGDWACLPSNCRPAKRMACSPRTAANIRGIRLVIGVPENENCSSTRV